MKTLTDAQLDELVGLVTDACDLREVDGRPAWDCDHEQSKEIGTDDHKSARNR
jgi:hypothetical protein